MRKIRLGGLAVMLCLQAGAVFAAAPAHDAPAATAAHDAPAATAAHDAPAATAAHDAPAATAAHDAPAAAAAHDGSHDFDFVIGDWKAHLRRRIDPKTGVTASEPGQGIWVDYTGISNHKKLLGTNANLEEFDVTDSKNHLHYKGQTLRMYNPASKQWSIYGVDLDKGEIAPSALTGSFAGKAGTFYHQEERGGRIMLVRYVWTDKGPTSAVMVQSFSPDGGKSWDANWICELSR